MAYHYDEKLQKYVIDDEPTGTTSSDTISISETDEKKQEAAGSDNKPPQYKYVGKGVEKKLGRLWWFWVPIALGLLGKLVKYVENLLNN